MGAYELMTTKDTDQISEIEEEMDEELDEHEDEIEDDPDYDDSKASAKKSAKKDEHDEETTEALEELESQELKLLEEEVDDAQLVDEVKELRAIRREELTMDVEAQGQRSDEFVCQSCFMVKRTSQLANKRKMLCADCAY